MKLKIQESRFNTYLDDIKEDYGRKDPRLDNIYDVVNSQLREMFYNTPNIVMYNDALEFSLPPSDGKLVTAATVKRWMKELPFKTFVKRTSPHAHISYSYDYYIRIDE